MRHYKVRLPIALSPGGLAVAALTACGGSPARSAKTPAQPPTTTAPALTPAQAALEHWWTAQVRPDLVNLLQVVQDAQDAIRRGYVTSDDANGCADLLTMTEATPTVATGALAATFASSPADLAAQQKWAEAVADYGDAAQACESGNLAVTASMLNEAEYHLGQFFRDLPGGRLKAPSGG